MNKEASSVTTAKDFSINVPHLIKQFKEETIIINADPKNTTPGIMGRKLRQYWLGDMLLMTGHTINYNTGKVEYTRVPKSKG